MPFALVLIGLVLIVTGAKNTHRAFGRTLVGDFTGPANFTYWLAAIGSIGALGYIEKIRPFSRAFMVLIIVAMFLANGGFFDRLQQALRTGPIAPPRNTDPASAAGVREAAGMLEEDLGFVPSDTATQLRDAETREANRVTFWEWLEEPIGGTTQIGRNILDTIWGELWGIRPAYAAGRGEIFRDIARRFWQTR